MLRTWAAKLVTRFTEWFTRRVKLPAFRTRAPKSSPDERRQWILALGTHPGFQLLVAELNNRRLLTEDELSKMVRSVTFQGTAEELRKMYRLQEQAYWAGWLQSKLVAAAHLEKWLASQAEQAQENYQVPEDNLG